MDSTTHSTPGQRFRDRIPPRVREFFANSADIIVLVIILLVIRGFIISPFQISGASMEKSLHDGELIITNKLIYSTLGSWEIGEPKRGDVVVFRPPHNRETFYIKRVIGVPGDTISFMGHDVLVNGVPLQEPYLNCVNFQDGVEMSNWCDYDGVVNREPWTVPDDAYFLMGDNRNNSTDSRTCFAHCNIGVSPFVPRSDIVGKAWVVLWPFWQQSSIEGPSGLRFAPTYSHQ